MWQSLVTIGQATSEIWREKRKAGGQHSWRAAITSNVYRKACAYNCLGSRAVPEIPKISLQLFTNSCHRRLLLRCVLFELSFTHYWTVLHLTAYLLIFAHSGEAMLF